MRITLAHLSDLHLGGQHNAIVSRVRQLAAAIASAEPSCKDYVVILSGDIANGGLAEEYRSASAFLEELSRQLSIHNPGSKAHYIAVPGNHDCYLPESELHLRSTLVKALAEILQDECPDPSTMESVLNAQKAYMEFAATLDVPVYREQRLCSFITREFESARVGFALYNTALLSTRDERQGTLAVPLSLARSTIPSETNVDLIVSVFHHPYPWLQADLGVTFRDHIEQTSDIVLTGHQHVEHAYMQLPLPGDSILYSEGDVLQEPRRPSRSGFRLIELDTDLRQRRLLLYSWDGDLFLSFLEADWHSYKRPAAATGRLSASVKFLEYLSDSGIGLIHNKKGPVPLDNIFVYPDVATSALSKPDAQIDVKGQNLFDYLSVSSKIIIRGAAYSGKTSLAKTIVREWLRSRSFYPLLGRVHTIKTISC